MSDSKSTERATMLYEGKRLSEYTRSEMTEIVVELSLQLVDQQERQKQSGMKMALVFLELLKQNDLLSGLGEGVLDQLYESAGLNTQTKEEK